MEYRVLGKTGLKISTLGFGGIPIQRIDAAGTKVLMQQMVEAGINYIDTARGYTVSESFLGESLEGIRDKFVLATKSMARTAEAMAADVQISLNNLRTKYIDLYQIHNPTLAQLDQVCAPGGALEALFAAREAGQIGHIGVTAHSVEVFEKALELDWVETIMFPYNIVESQGEDLIRKCAEKNIGFIVMKPLAGGAIEDTTLALRYVCANPNISVVIPGMADPKELELPFPLRNWHKSRRFVRIWARNSAAVAITAHHARPASPSPMCFSLTVISPDTGWLTGQRAVMKLCPRKHRTASVAVSARHVVLTTCPSDR